MGMQGVADESFCWWFVGLARMSAGLRQVINGCLVIDPAGGCMLLLDGVTELMSCRTERRAAAANEPVFRRAILRSHDTSFCLGVC